MFEEEESPQKQQQQQQQQISRADPLAFSRYVPMYAAECVYDPPFVKSNPLTIPIEFVKGNDNFQTHLIDMIMYEKLHEEACIGLERLSMDVKTKEREEEEERPIESEAQEEKRQPTADAYANEKNGLFFMEEDQKMGFLPNQDLFRLGNGTPIAVEDYRDGHFFESQSPKLEEIEKEKERIYKSISSLNALVHFVYARSKRQAILIERMGDLSLFSKLYKLYDVIAFNLKSISQDQSDNTGKVTFTAVALLKIRSILLKFGKMVTRRVVNDDAHAYALIYNIHRAKFTESAVENIKSIDSTFAALMGQEMWLVLHYLLPSMNDMYKKTVGFVFYEKGLYEDCDIDAYSYTYGEVFVRDFYRFEIVTHEMFLRTAKNKKCATEDEIYKIIFDMSIQQGTTVQDIAVALKELIGIPDENVPTVYFWVFNLVNATRESNAQLQSGKTINATDENEEEEEEEKLEGENGTSRQSF